jgi:hypothetical protein
MVIICRPGLIKPAGQAPARAECGRMYPSAAHEHAVAAVAGHFKRRPGVWALVLVGSLGRGAGRADSDADLAIFHEGPFDLAAESAACATAVSGTTSENFGVVLGRVRVDLEPTAGDIRPLGGLLRLDPYELEIGNLAVHASPLWDPDGRWQTWRQQFLPYLPDEVRAQRMAAVAADFRHNLREVERMGRGGEFFEALQRLIFAQRYLLHYLFLRARVYPVDYTKHVAWQCRELLGLPGLAAPLQEALAVGRGDAAAVADKVGGLAALWRRFAEE